MFGNNPHLEVREGTHSEAKHYNSKPHAGCICVHCTGCPPPIMGPFIFGDDEGIPEGQGQRNDLLAVKRKIDDGTKDADLWEDHFSTMVHNHRAFKIYRSIKLPKRAWEMQCITLVGDTGVGKTRWAYDTYPNLYPLPPAKQSGCYWDGYEGQEVVLVDEMYGNRFSHGFLLMLTDRYPFQVPFHGGQMNFCSRIIIFTSNAHPDEWFSGVNLDGTPKFPFAGGPLERRLTQGESRIDILNGAIV